MTEGEQGEIEKLRKDTDEACWKRESQRYEAWRDSECTSLFITQYTEQAPKRLEQQAELALFRKLLRRHWSRDRVRYDPETHDFTKEQWERYYAFEKSVIQPEPATEGEHWDARYKREEERYRVWCAQQREADEKQEFLMRLRNTRLYPHWNPSARATETEPELFRRMLMGTPPKRIPYTPDAWGMPQDQFARYLDFVGAVVGRDDSLDRETPTEMAERISREEQRYQAWWAEQGEIEWLRYKSALTTPKAEVPEITVRIPDTQVYVYEEPTTARSPEITACPPYPPHVEECMMNVSYAEACKAHEERLKRARYEDAAKVGQDFKCLRSGEAKGTALMFDF